MYKMKEGKTYFRLQKDEMLDVHELSDGGGSLWGYPFEEDEGYADMSKNIYNLRDDILTTKLIRVMYAETI